MYANRSIRAALAYYNVKQWQLATHLGFTQQYLCQLLRKELDSDRRKQYLKAIKEIAED